MAELLTKGEGGSAAVEPDDKDWTIMVYMAGDNNLSENMAVSLDEVANEALNLPSLGRTAAGDLRGIIASRDANLLVYFDGSSLTAPTRYIDYSDGKPEPTDYSRKCEHYQNLRRASVQAQGTAASDAPIEGNASSAYSIMNFVHWCVNERKRKAKNYALIFSGHSFGFHGSSFLRDEGSGGFISLWRFRWALQKVVEDCLREKIAILGFDSCVMSMLEVGCELDGVATTIVASEGSLPNSGWSYSALLGRVLADFRSDTVKLLENPDGGVTFRKTFGLDFKDRFNFDLPVRPASPEKLDGPDAETIMDELVKDPAYIRGVAGAFVESLINRHNKLLIGGRSIDVAAWDLREVGEVAKSLNELAKAFNEHFDIAGKIENESLTDEHIATFHELKKLLLQAHYDAQTYMNEQCVDLKDFCKLLIIECKFMEGRKDIGHHFSSLIELCRDVIKMVDACVIKSGFSGDEYQHSNGISIFFPWSHLTLELTNYRYQYLIFSQGPHKEPRRDLQDLKTYEGVGKDWYFFLLNYIHRVTIRGARKVRAKGADGAEIIVPASLDNFSRSNPIWSKSNPIWTRSNPIWTRGGSGAGGGGVDSSRSNPPWTKSNPPWTKSNPPWSKSNPPWTKGEMGNYLFYFARFKNFENIWDVSGFADEFPFDHSFDDQDADGDKPPLDKESSAAATEGGPVG